MNTTKRINVNCSSLVGLKAELLRKQIEVKDAKAKIETPTPMPKPKVRNKKIKEEKLTTPAELIDVDDVNAHKKSKLMLEAKTRLYERLRRNRHNTNESFLVDFSNKSDESEEEPPNEEDYEETTSDPEDDWVEYQDCFGRTRKCLRRDLPRMREKDELVQHEVMKRHSREDEDHDGPPAVNTVPMPEKEPEIEMMRKKWEKQMEKLADKSDIHYQDVLFDEARAHGVGYYAFAQDEELRAKQQADLVKLRKETEQRQKEMNMLREMKNKMEKNRLKAARIRQRIRAGLPAEPIEEEEEEEEVSVERERTENNLIAKQNKGENDDSKQEDKTEGEHKEKSEDSLVTIENKIKAFGELLGKRTHWHEMSQEEWVYKRRKDRDTEFAPVYDSFRSAGYLRSEDIPDKKETDVDEEPDIGPVPLDTPNTEKVIARDNQPPISPTTCIDASIAADSNLPTERDVPSDDDESDMIGPLPPSPVTSPLEKSAHTIPVETTYPVSSAIETSPIPPTAPVIPSTENANTASHDSAYQPSSMTIPNPMLYNPLETYTNNFLYGQQTMVPPVNSNEYMYSPYAIPPPTMYGYTNYVPPSYYANPMQSSFSYGSTDINGITAEIPPYDMNTTSNEEKSPYDQISSIPIPPVTTTSNQETLQGNSVSDIPIPPPSKASSEERSEPNSVSDIVIPRSEDATASNQETPLEVPIFGIPLPHQSVVADPHTTQSTIKNTPASYEYEDSDDTDSNESDERSSRLTIDENKIAAGLKYLWEKFEKTKKG